MRNKRETRAERSPDWSRGWTKRFRKEEEIKTNNQGPIITDYNNISTIGQQSSGHSIGGHPGTQDHSTQLPLNKIPQQKDVPWIYKQQQTESTFAKKEEEKKQQQQVVYGKNNPKYPGF